MGKYGRLAPIPSTTAPFSSATAPNIRSLEDKGERARGQRRISWEAGQRAKRGDRPVRHAALRRPGVGTQAVDIRRFLSPHFRTRPCRRNIALRRWGRLRIQPEYHRSARADTTP